MACVAVAFDTPRPSAEPATGLADKRIPADVLPASCAPGRAPGRAAREGFDDVLTPEPVRVVPSAFVGAAAAARRQQERPTGLRFGLHIGEFTRPGGRGDGASWLREVAAAAAEAAGFDAIYVMDHFRQIPQVGRAWDDFLESYTTLAYLAACTSRVRSARWSPASPIATSRTSGRSSRPSTCSAAAGRTCGLGLAWFGAEHAAYGWAFPPVAERYALLEDALGLLPLLWGPGSPPFEGRVLTVPEAACYPRPLQEHVPVIVGGGGERRTLRLAAQYADAANVFGDAATVAAQGGRAARRTAARSAATRPRSR